MAASTATEITNFLTEANRNKDANSLECAYRLLQQLQLESAVVTVQNEDKGTHVNPDLHLFCCEAAIGLGKWEMAKQCIIPVLHSGTTTKANEVRAAYCRALIEASESRTLRCELLIQRVVDAVAKVVQGIRTALQDPSKLSQLVIIGTQHLWNICQPLFREGTFHTIAAVIGFAVYSLETIEYNNVVSRANWMMRYAVALNGSGRYPEATAYMSRAVDFITKYCPQLRYTALKLQIALTKQYPNPRVKEGVKGIAKDIYTAQSFLAGLVEPAAALEDVLASYESIMADIVALETGVEKPPTVVDKNAKPGTATKGGAKGPTTPRGKKGPAAQQGNEAEKSEEAILLDETLGDIGLCLALLGQEQQAAQCAAHLTNSRSLQARVYSEYIGAWVAANKCGGFAIQNTLHMGSLTPAIEAELINTVRSLERSLQSAVHITNTRQRTHVVQHGVIMMWNVALPLLQSKQRAQISRSLQVAVKLLDDVQSNLNELRALLHYEVSLSDVDCDYLGKATSRLDKALGIDYRVAPGDSKLFGTDRPWDRFLGWTRRSLEMRANLYQTPNNPLDEALLIVEQSKDATIANRVSMLTKAEGILSRSEPSEDYVEDTEEEVAAPAAGAATVASPGKGGVSPPASPSRAGKSTPTGKGKRPATAGAAVESAPRDEGLESRRSNLQHRAQLWHLILTYGWRDMSALAIPVCRAAANALLARSWPRRGDRDMLVLQADAHLKLAEMRMAELAQQKMYVAQLKVTDVADDSMDGDIAPGAKLRAQQHNSDASIEERMRLVSEVTSTVQQHIIAVCDIAMRLIRAGYPDQWLLLNAAIFLWNAFLPSFKDNNFMGALESLQVVVPALVDADNRVDPQTETKLYQDLLLVFAKCLVQLFMVRKLAGSSNAPSTATVAEVVAIKSFHEFSATDPNSQYLGRAWDVCDKGIQLLRTPMDAKEFLMLTATIRRFQGKPVDTNTRTLPQEKLLIIIDQLFHPTTSTEERGTLIKIGLDLLSQDPNVELCARFAEKAMGSHNKVAARAAIIGKNLCDEKKLGLKQNEAVLAHRRPATANSGTKKDGKEEGKGKDKKKNAAEVAEVVEVPPAPIPDPDGDDFQWYSLLLMYKGCVTVSLLNPAVQDKTTQIEIRRQALAAIAESVTYALKGSRAFATLHIMQCYRHFRNIAQDLAGDPVSRHFTYENLRTALCDAALRLCAPFSVVKANATRLSDAEVVAQLLLLLLKVLCDNRRADEGMAVMKTAITLLPTNQHKPFWALDIQLRCEAGLSTAQTLMRVKEFSAEMQAQTYLALARHGKDKMDQLYAYQRAIELMQAKPVERAELMISMAQWALEANAPLSLADVRGMILSAVDLAASDGDEDKLSLTTTSTMGRVMANVENALASVTNPQSARAASRQGPPSTAATEGGRSRKSGRSQANPMEGRATIRQIFVAVQGYYVLSKIASHAPETVDGVLVDARTCLHMVVHYVMRAWETMAEAANSHNREAKAKWAAQEAKAAQLARQQQAEALAMKDDSPPPPVENAKPDKKMTKAQQAAAAAAAAAKAEALAVVSTIPKAERPDFPDDVVLPATPQAWIGTHFPVGLLKTMRALDSPFALNATSMENPDAMVALLRDVVEEMVREGIELQTPPLTALQALMLHVFYPAETDTRIQAIELESTVRAWDVCYRVGAVGATDPYSTLAPVPSAEERAALAEDSLLVQKHKQTLSKQSTAGSAPIVVRPPSRSQLPIHHYWLSMAAMLLREGRVGQVRELLGEAAMHATAHMDSGALAMECYLEAQLAYIDGRFEDSLAMVAQAFNGGEPASAGNNKRVPIARNLLIDLCMLKAANFLALDNLDGAFAAEAETQHALGSQLSTLQGLAREVGQNLIPDLQLTTCVRFSRLVIGYIERHQSLSVAIAPKVRQAGCTENINTLEEAIAALRNIVANANSLAPQCPHLVHAVLLLEIELDRVEVASQLPNGSHKAHKARLQQQAASLEVAIESIRAELGPGNEPLDNADFSARSTVHASLATLLVALGCNIAQRVQLNQVLLEDLRQSTFTRIEVPVMEGQPESLRKEVIKFMRSTAKMREATQRRNQREAIRAKIEEQRVVLREQKQREVERLREQRRQDEALAAVAPTGKRDTKGSRGGTKGGRRKSDTEESRVEPIPDVDPNDKCDLESPHTSDDEGLAEDSQSDEEEELESALEGLPDVTTEVRLSYGDAFAVFSQAVELMGGASRVSSIPDMDPQFHVGAALRRVAEGEIISLDQRSAVVSGRDLPSLLQSPTLLRCWSLPIDFTRRPETEDRPAPATRNGKDDKSASKGQKGAAAAKAAEKEQATPPPALPEVRHSPIQQDTHRISYPSAPAVPAAQQAIAVLLGCASRAHAVGSRVQLAAALHELADAAAMQHNSSMAGQAIEMAQAALASDYVLSLWKELGPADTPEAALTRLVDFVGKEASHLMGSQHYLGLLGLLQHYSPMHVRLSLPDPSFLANITPDQPVTTPRGSRGPMSSDSVFLTLTCQTTDYFTNTRLIAVLRRPGNQIDTRMAIVSTAQLEELILKCQRLSNARQMELQGGRGLNSEAEASYVAYVSEVGTLLEPLLKAFTPLLQPLHGKLHVTLGLHPRLYPLPLEGIDALARCTTVSRDISIFTYQQRLLRKNADRYAPNNVQCMVDPFAENDDNSIRYVFGDIQPRAPLFSNLTTTIDSNRQLRPVQPAQVLRMFTQPTANSVLIDVGGRFTSTCPIGDLCGLHLDHMRAAFLFERAVNGKATRRENERNMAKSPNVLRLESSFWALPLLLLARGVDYVAISTLPTSVPFVDSIAHCAYQALERPACNFTDVLSTFAPRFCIQPAASIPALTKVENAVLPLGVGQYGGGSISPSLPPIPQQKPGSRPSSTATKPLTTKESASISIAVSTMEAASLKFFGVAPSDENAVVAPPNPKAK